jgi:hypothetical protein
MPTRTRLGALCFGLALLVSGCNGDGDGTPPDANAAGSPTAAGPVYGSGATTDPDAGGAGSCDTDFGLDAYLRADLTGGVTETVDWTSADVDCGGSAFSDTLALTWEGPGLAFQASGITPGPEGTGTGIPGDLLILVGDEDPIGYRSNVDGCTFDITTNEVAGEFIRFVAGTGTCGPLTEIGFDGVITVEGQLAFAVYVPGTT